MRQISIPQKSLILGGSSYIGRYLFDRLGSENAIATYNMSSIDNGVYFNSLSMSISDIVKSPENISHAVILLGDTEPDSCAADIKRSNALNVESIKSIIKYLNEWKIKPVFASSEFVFDGENGNYVETDQVNPILVYGKQKVEIEKYIQNNCENFIIIRIAKVYGSKCGDGTLFTNWIDAIKQNKTIYCAKDQSFSPVYIEDLTESIVRLIENNCNGIFHLSGNESYNRLELFETLLSQVKRNKKVDFKVVPCSIHDFDLKEKRPLNVSMNADKLVKVTGITLSNVEHICEEIVKKEFSSTDCTD